MPKRSPAVLPEAEAHLLGRWFTAARREGLLSLLAPEVWHTLSALLSFTDRDGERRFTLDQLALALGVPRAEAEARLARLIATRWQDQPLARVVHGPEGEVAGVTLAPLETLSRVRPVAPKAESPEPETPDPERIVPPVSGASAPEAGLRRELSELGLDPAQVDHLLRLFPTERIQRQLGWLPARAARNPAALLIRAIEQDWEVPREAE